MLRIVTNRFAKSCEPAKGAIPAINNQLTLAHFESMVFEIAKISTYHAPNFGKRW